MLYNKLVKCSGTWLDISCHIFMESESGMVNIISHSLNKEDRLKQVRKKH